MLSKAKLSRLYENLHQALPLIPTYLAPEHTLCPDDVILRSIFRRKSEVVEPPQGAVGGLPAEVWSVIFEKLCPASTSLIVAPSVIARDISNAQLVCHTFYLTGPVAWRALSNLVRAEAGNFVQPEAIPSCKATEDLHELDTQRRIYTQGWHAPHKNHSFSSDHIKILQQEVSWEDVLSKPQLYDPEGLDKARMCSSMQYCEQDSTALQLFATLRNAAQHIFGLQHPCDVPAAILLAVKHEKALAAIHVCKYSDLVKDVKSAVKVVARHFDDTSSKAGPSAFHFRQLLHSRARSIEELLKLAADLRRTTPVEPTKQKTGKQIDCDCGDVASLQCAYRCCNLCCPRPCNRHKEPKIRRLKPPLFVDVAALSKAAALKRKQELIQMAPRIVKLNNIKCS